MKNRTDVIRIKPSREPEERKEPYTLIEQAYRQIKQMIFDQTIVPGQRLVYRDLCKILNMSRTPIINALNRLEQEGFVASESFRGFYVKPLDLQEVWDAFGVREALEVYAVEQAVKFGDAGDLAILEEKRLKHEQYALDHNRGKFLLDAEFHIQIASMSKNQVLKYLLKRNLEHVYLRARFDNFAAERMTPSIKEHRRLVDRIKKKDVLGSIEMIRNHVQSTRDQVIRFLSSVEFDIQKSSLIQD